MKNLLFIILTVYSFNIFSQSKKVDPKEQLLKIVNEKNTKVLNSFNCDSSSIETIKLINNYRKLNNLNELSIDTSLMRYSVEYAKILALSDNTKHSEIELSNIKTENLYMERGYGMFLISYDELSKLPFNSVSSWKTSVNHNKNMLINGATKIGIGTYITKNNGYRINVVMVIF